MPHTKGPWHRNIKPARKYPIIFAGRNTHVCQVLNHVDDAEMEANCNLITAAPALLDAVEALLDGCPLDLNSKPLITNLRRVVAAAKGES